MRSRFIVRIFRLDVNSSYSFTEFNPTQPVTAQPVHAGTKRGYGQVILVDDQSRREARQVSTTASRLHGDV